MRTAKYKNKRTEYNGRMFASKLEARYCEELDWRVKAGEVLYYLTQVPLRLDHNITYWCDFLEFHADGSHHYIDTKGFRTEAFKMKKKMVEGQYPIEIEEKYT